MVDDVLTTSSLSDMKYHRDVPGLFDNPFASFYENIRQQDLPDEVQIALDRDVVQGLGGRLPDETVMRVMSRCRVWPRPPHFVSGPCLSIDLTTRGGHHDYLLAWDGERLWRYIITPDLPSRSNRWVYEYDGLHFEAELHHHNDPVRGPIPF